MKRISLLMSLLILTMLVPLFSASLREQDDYAYIIELYDLQDYSEALDEIDYFVQTYPNSEFMDYLDYIRANIALAQADYTLAENLYEPLTSKSLHASITADVSLNYALALFQNGKLNEALKALRALSRQSDHPYYIFNGSLLRGKCYQALEQYLSAEHEYSKAYAIDDSDSELNLEYFKLLLRIDHEENALELRTQAATDTILVTNMNFQWLRHLLQNQRYDEMDSFLEANPPLDEDSETITSLILTQKDIQLQDYHRAQERLDQIDLSNPQARFFQALIYKHDGEIEQADSIFRDLTADTDPQLAFFSYLEHLQIMHLSDPDRAKQLLQDYIDTPLPGNMRGYQYVLMATMEADNAKTALKYWIQAKDYELPMDMLDRVQTGIADAYLLMEQKPLAIENYNKYLNSFPSGINRAKAFFLIGKMEYELQNYQRAQQNLQIVIEQYPTSAFYDEASFILAEISFLASRYEEALAYYQAISPDNPSARTVFLRISQCCYYLDDFASAQQYLSQVNSIYKDYESLILEASLSFNQRDFATALGLYQQAQTMATNPSLEQEAGSYQAYTLYFLKRFDEAAQLFLTLSELNPDVDSYLYQAGRAAYAGKAFNRAMEIYDRFIDNYPESEFFVNVLTHIAQTYYNLGEIEQSFADWTNILTRFRSHTGFSSEELGILHDTFNGLSLCLDNLTDVAMLTELMDMADTFQSEYIQFEINYLVVKHFADLGLWTQVLQEAEELRQRFPNHKTAELDLLLAQSLVQLNQQQKAQQLVSEIYDEAQDPQSLATLADLAKRTGDFAQAQRFYSELFEKEPNGTNWLSWLEISEQNGYLDYEEIWEAGQSYTAEYPQATINRIRYLITVQDYEQAAQIANSILDSAANQFIRGQAEYELAYIMYLQGDYARSTASFKRIRVLYRDYPQIQNKAQYHYILSLINSGALKEAQLTLWEVQSQLSDEQIIIINDLLDTQR
ncbi:MAG: tetratricopeptide repeat protein [Candidatus Cloacimonadaceae bacterium]|jgi:tetratricopeptide (TPR) repeat protein